MKSIGNEVPVNTVNLRKYAKHTALGTSSLLKCDEMERFQLRALIPSDVGLTPSYIIHFTSVRFFS
jgi:hypothetical protein